MEPNCNIIGERIWIFCAGSVCVLMQLLDLALYFVRSMYLSSLSANMPVKIHVTFRDSRYVASLLAFPPVLCWFCFSYTNCTLGVSCQSGQIPQVDVTAKSIVTRCALPTIANGHLLCSLVSIRERGFSCCAICLHLSFVAPLVMSPYAHPCATHVIFSFAFSLSLCIYLPLFQIHVGNGKDELSKVSGGRAAGGGTKPSEENRAADCNSNTGGGRSEGEGATAY